MFLFVITIFVFIFSLLLLIITNFVSLFSPIFSWNPQRCGWANEEISHYFLKQLFLFFITLFVWSNSTQRYSYIVGNYFLYLTYIDSMIRTSPTTIYTTSSITLCIMWWCIMCVFIYHRCQRVSSRRWRAIVPFMSFFLRCVGRHMLHMQKCTYWWTLCTYFGCTQSLSI
jgi:hypothetical protein